MDQSRCAVESYWRSRMVDGVTTDDNKVSLVYKLDSKSPLVKQKVRARARVRCAPPIGFTCCPCLPPSLAFPLAFPTILFKSSQVC
jgi:hypothetical protein